MQHKKPLMPSKSSQSRPKPPLEEILQMLRDRLPQLREEYSIRDIWLFGSYVRGEQLRSGDLDVLVEFEEVPTLPRFNLWSASCMT
jgi:predicted nucleotidyltransferase